jgi:hypothetical protein
MRRITAAPILILSFLLLTCSPNEPAPAVGALAIRVTTGGGSPSRRSDAPPDSVVCTVEREERAVRSASLDRQPDGGFTGTFADLAAGGGYTVAVYGRNMAGGNLSFGAAGGIVVETGRTAVAEIELGAFRPAPAAPENGSISLTRTPRFRWNGLPGVSTYAIQACRDSAFQSVLFSVEGLATATFTPSEPLEDGPVHWRVAATDARGETGVWSDAWFFTVNPDAMAGPAPAFPAEGDRFCAFPVTFEWNAASEAEEYELQVDDDPDFSSPDYRAEHVTSTMHREASALPAGDYRWRVRAFDRNGMPGRWSEIRTFERRDELVFQTTSVGGNGLAAVGTADGGAVVLGENNQTVLLSKADAGGRLLWTRSTTGGGRIHYGRSIIGTSDGGFLIAGGAQGGAGGYKSALLRVDADGNKLWCRNYGDHDGGFLSLLPVPGGGAIAAGSLYSNRYTAAPIIENYDAYLAAVDDAGDTLWTSVFGLSEAERVYRILGTADGGFAVAGETTSFEGNSQRFYMARTDARGNPAWQTHFPGTAGAACDLDSEADGGFVLTGSVVSPTSSDFDFLSIRTDVRGSELERRRFSIWGDDCAFSGALAPDGDVRMAGYALAPPSRMTSVVLRYTPGRDGCRRTFLQEGTVYFIEPAGGGDYVVAGTRDEHVWVGRYRPEP